MVNQKSLSSFWRDWISLSFELNLNCGHLSFKAISEIWLAISGQETIRYLVFQPLNSFSHSLYFLQFLRKQHIQ